MSIQKTLAKHQKYQHMYGENEMYWGLGIEEETYFQFTKPIHVASSIIRSNHKTERYSVNYYNSFKQGYRKYFDKLFPDASGCIPLPFFFNGHALQQTDYNGNHRTTYEKVPKPNPKFAGKSFLDELQQYNPEVFKEQLGANYVFDGDTIEFITLDFYKAKSSDVINELIHYKKMFLRCINDFMISKNYHKRWGHLEYPARNPGWAVFFTNPQNILMFNNGTYHVNITIPSFLGNKKSENETPPLLYPELFRQQHKKVILYYQWFEPFLIAEYGTPDPFSSHFDTFAKSSQRCAMSRYIGVGTFDTQKMTEGKILTKPRSDIRGADNPYWWYTRFHSTSAYEPLNEIGLDINYRKHYNHGIELRFFDWFPEDRLKGLLKFLISLADCALVKPEADEPMFSETWNDFIYGIFKEGKSYVPTSQVVAMYEKLLGFELPERPTSLTQLFNLIRDKTFLKYRGGLCCKVMLN
jgi:hypothetical protein